MPEWSADFINDPNSDFDVVLEVRCNDDDVAVIRKKKKKIEFTWYANQKDLTIPGELLLELIKVAEERLV